MDARWAYPLSAGPAATKHSSTLLVNCRTTAAPLPESPIKTWSNIRHWPNREVAVCAIDVSFLGNCGPDSLDASLSVCRRDFAYPLRSGFPTTPFQKSRNINNKVEVRIIRHGLTTLSPQLRAFIERTYVAYFAGGHA